MVRDDLLQSSKLNWLDISIFFIDYCEGNSQNYSKGWL